ncbi:hypothetical protein H4R18_002266 [Coemansia javaensis]|uniref:S1-like domain-containing protein n=1 Tax=Coemansia javaensis TaxID=2761396 RepID=A0A9W8HH88_9FUNG|nr:hypothetical protein H4R18_002266 [Coemansia javaensis]
MGRGKRTALEALHAKPQPTETCPVALVLGPRGQHLHEVAIARSLVSDEVNGRLNAEGRAWFTTLAQLPPKFRSVVWVRRGGYVLVDVSEQLTDKVGGEIAMVLLAAQVKQLRLGGAWPREYEELWPEIWGQDGGRGPGGGDGKHDDDGGDGLLEAGNLNHRRADVDEPSSESSSESSDGE